MKVDSFRFTTTDAAKPLSSSRHPMSANLNGLMLQFEPLKAHLILTNPQEKEEV
jgi:hypothetical protein